MTNIITTNRLSLRLFDENDIDYIAPILAEIEVMRYSKTGVMNKREVLEKINYWNELYNKYTFAPFAIIFENKIIGYAGIDIRYIEGEEKAQITYRLSKQYWNMGFATEVTEAIKKYAFKELELDEVVAIIDENNKASINVAKKLGMRLLQTTKYNEQDLHIYGMRNE